MSRRKLGTSRRNKGKQLAKDPETQPYLETREDFEEETRRNKTLETEVLPATQLEIQDDLTRGSKHGIPEMHDSTLFSESSSEYSVDKNTTVSPEDMESSMSKTDSLQTCKIDSRLEETDESNFLEREEVEENTPIDGLSEAPDSSISSCASVDQQLMNKQAANSSMHAAAKSENNKDDTDLFRQDGSLQGNHMVSESQISSVVLDSIKPEITTDKSSSNENTEVKFSVEQALLLLPKDELPANEEHDFAQHSEDSVNKVHDEDGEPTQVQGLVSTSDPRQDIYPEEGDFKAVDQRNKADHVYVLKQMGNNTETGKTDVGQMYEGGVHVEDDVKQSVEQTVHQERDLFEAERINSSLQTLPSETYVHFDSQHQDRSLKVDEQTDPGHIGNKRKFGSRRRNKGKQHLKESEEEVLAHDKDDQPLEKEKILEPSKTSQEELSEGTGHDVILSVSHGSSLTSPGHSVNVQSSSPEDYTETDPEHFILKSENLPEDQNERETEINVDLSNKLVEVMPEDADKSDTLYSEDTRGVHRPEDAREVQGNEVHPTQIQEILQTNNSSEAMIDNASENPEISESLMNQFKITNQSDSTEESTDDFATKQEVSTLVVNQNNFAATERILEAVDQRNKDDPVYDLKQTCIINTECIETTMGQKHEDIKHNPGQSVEHHEDRVFSESQTSSTSPQTLPSELNVLPDSQFQDSSGSMDDLTLTGFSQTGNSRNLHSEDAVEKVQAEADPAQMQEIVQRDYSPATLPDDAPVNLEITSEILTGQAEINNTHQSEFTEKSTHDSTTKETASNLEDKPDEYSTKRDISEALDLRNEDYELYGGNKPQISDLENSAPSQIHGFTGRVERGVEPNTDQIFHQEEGPPCETEEMKPAGYQPQDSSVGANENSHTDFHHSSNRRKLGSSRRNKGKHKVKESVIEAYHETRKEADANSSSHKSSEAVLTVEMAGQEKSVEILQEEEEKTGSSQTEVVNFDTRVCTPELPPIDEQSTSTDDQSVFEKSCHRQMPDEDFPSVYSIADTVSEEGLECTELLRQDGNLQNYLVCEQLVHPITQEIHSEKSNSGEHAKNECRTEKGSPEDELHTKEEQLNKVKEAQQSEDAVKTEHGQEIEPTQMQGMSQTDYTTDKNRDDAAVDAEFAMKSANDPKAQISDEERLENELGDVYEVQGPVIMNPSDEEMGHQVREGLHSETGDTESSLQSLQQETHAVLDSQSQHNDTSLNPGGNSEAVGSSQEKSTEIKLEGIDKSDTSHMDDMAVHSKQNAHLGTVTDISEFTTSSPSVKQQLIKSNSRKLPDDKLPSVSTATENKEPDEDTEKLGPCGNLKGNHLSSENVEFSIPPERTTEKSSQKDQTEVENSVEQETFLSQENFPTNRKQEEHFNSSKAEEALDSEDAVTSKNDEHVNQTQMDQINYNIIGENSLLQTLPSAIDLSPLDSQPQDSCQSSKDESCPGVRLAGNRRKLGSSRRDKTKQQAKVSKANQESKEGVVEDTEMLAASTTKQEELEDLISAEKVRITSTMSGDENTEKLLNVLDNSAVTSDINPGSDNGDSLKFIKDLDERHTRLVKEPDNLSELTGHDTVSLMQSPQVCVEKDDSDVQSILYHDDIISPGSGIVHVGDQEAAFQCQNTEVSSCDKDSQGQEVHLQQTDCVTETVKCVTIEDCNTEVERSMDAQGPEQDEAGEKHVHAVQEIDTSQESAVGMSYESGISAPMDVRNSLQEKTQSDDSENSQAKSKERRRKMGSSRKMRLNRKQEEDTDSKESDLNTEAEVRDLDKLEAVEELSTTAEVLQNEHAQPLQSTREQEKTEENETLHHEEQKLQSCTFDTQGKSTAFLSEESASINPAALKMAVDERDEERNVDKLPQLDDFTSTEIQLASVATGTNNSALSQLLPPNTEANSGMSKQTHVESVKPEQVQDTDGQKPSDLHEGTQCRNLDVRSPSPDLNSPNRRRKLGSTRKSLSSRTRRDVLNQKQELENKPTETAPTGENIMAESASRIEEKDLQLNAEHKDSDSDQRKDNAFEAMEISHIGGSLTKPLTEQSAEESPVSQSQVTETENRLTPSTSPKNDTLSELASDGRRRKLGSNRKSRLHQSNKAQSARGARMMDAQHEYDVIEEDAHKAAEERREESPGLDKRSEVDESDEKALSFSISKPASEKTPVQSEISFGQESQRELSFADPRRTDLRSNCYNVVMVGDSCVGKTSFMKRAQSGKFSLDIPASVGLDSCMWTVLVEGKPVVLQLWDTAGQERFRSITRQIFHKAQAFLLMYDITSSQSFSAVSYWANSIQEAATENVTVLLLGNKSDNARRQVKTEQGEILAKEYNYEFLECSAATGENVIQALEIVARMLSQRADFREEATILHKEPVQKKRSTCC